MFRRQVVRYSTLNNISKVHKKPYSTECFDDKKPDVKLINFQLNIDNEKFNNFKNKFNTHKHQIVDNLCSDNTDIINHRGGYGMLCGFVVGSVAGGLSGDLLMCFPGMIFGVGVGYLIFAGAPMVIFIGCALGISVTIGYVAKKLFYKE